MRGFTAERRKASVQVSKERRRDQNRDPISGAPGAHPVGTGIGAAAGGLAGKGVAEMVDPTAQAAYWKENYLREPYYERGYSFDDYLPAYRTGWEGRQQYQGRSFEEMERDLEFDYARNRGSSRLSWEKCRMAARAAWDRFEISEI